MSEKKGATEKLIYPFNDAGCLEVEYKQGTWVRVTPREFRSYSAPRRISCFKDKEYVTEVYDGPVYYYGSNKIVDHEETQKQKIHYLNDVDPRKLVKDNRSFGRL